MGSYSVARSWKSYSDVALPPFIAVGRASRHPRSGRTSKSCQTDNSTIGSTANGAKALATREHPQLNNQAGLRARLIYFRRQAPLCSVFLRITPVAHDSSLKLCFGSVGNGSVHTASLPTRRFVADVRPSAGILFQPCSRSAVLSERKQNLFSSDGAPFSPHGVFSFILWGLHFHLIGHHFHFKRSPTDAHAGHCRLSNCIHSSTRKTCSDNNSRCAS
jgi:hypothetical protein